VAYLLTAIVLGYFSLTSMMWSIWGAPILPNHHLALLGTLGLLITSVTSLFSLVGGRSFAVISLAALGSLWAPAVMSLVPQHNVIVGPLGFGLVAVYFAAVAFTLLYPVRWKWSVPVLLLVLGGAVTPVVATGINRIQRGEYAWPSFAFFRWSVGGDALQVEYDPDQWIDSDTQALLEHSGIRGRLHWTGSSGLRSATHRIILLARSQPPTSYPLYHPLVGTLIYSFDGSRWRKIPSGARTYPTYATIEPEGSNTILSEDIGVGRQGTTAFMWQDSDGLSN